MSTAEQWASALSGGESAGFRLRFERLGLEAQCRPLTSGEVEECIRMGGERGLRYALYLSCRELREAGESLRKQGSLGSPFDITRNLSYGDVAAAGAYILQRSGTDGGMVKSEDGDNAAGMEFARNMPGFAEQTGLFPENLRKTGEKAGENSDFFQKDDHWGLADKLLAAWGNR